MAEYGHGVIMVLMEVLVVEVVVQGQCGSNEGDDEGYEVILMMAFILVEAVTSV